MGKLIDVILCNSYFKTSLFTQIARNASEMQRLSKLKREWDDAREAVAMMVKGKDGGEKSDPEADGRCILY